MSSSSALGIQVMKSSQLQVHATKALLILSAPSQRLGTNLRLPSPWLKHRSTAQLMLPFQCNVKYLWSKEMSHKVAKQERPFGNTLDQLWLYNLLVPLSAMRPSRSCTSLYMHYLYKLCWWNPTSSRFFIWSSKVGLGWTLRGHHTKLYSTFSTTRYYKYNLDSLGTAYLNPWGSPRTHQCGSRLYSQLKRPEVEQRVASWNTIANLGL